MEEEMSGDRETERLQFALETALERALDENERLREQADCGGVNCGKCQQCLTVNEHFLKLGNQRLREALGEAFSGVETLRGYTHNLTDGCEPSLNRGKHFTAHVDSIADTLREALAGDGE
jgi:hypothetical protein